MSAPTIIVRDLAIGPDARPLVVAEMSGNHNGQLERALALVDAAVDAGAGALKIQTYTADTMTLDIDGPGFVIEDEDSLWHGYTLHRLYDEAHTPWEWHEAIFERCAERSIICFSAPFDATAVDFLEELDCPIYKIASFENVDIPLIKKAASTGKPLIISTGMASADELDDAVEAARSSGCRDLVLLKCTSSYPADPSASNIATIPELAERYGCHVGLSDHTLGLGVACASVALGAVVVEKHFTLARADGGVDSAFSLEPQELRSLVEETERAWHSVGEVFFGRTSSEESSLAFRRSLYATENVAAGEEFTRQNVRAIRPGFGLPPKHTDEVLGRRASEDIARGTPLSWELVE